MSSAPIPAELANRSADPLGAAAFGQTTLKVIKDRNGAHIPSFYRMHEDPAGTLVTQNGVPIPGVRGKLSFTVADVAPERRWAITESGEVLPQHVFESQLQLVREEWFAEVQKVKAPGDLSKEPIPTVQFYVSRTVDPTHPGRLIPIGFDENAKPDDGIERRLWDAKGEEYVSGDERLRLLVDAYHSPTKRKVLKPWEIEEVERHLGGSQAPGDTQGLVSKLEELNAMLASGDITAAVHSRRVALLTGAPVPAEAKAAKPPRKVGVLMACGVRVPGFQKRRHLETCETCQTGSEAA